MKINVFNTLPKELEPQDIHDELITLCANVINAYIMEDGLAMKENEKILEILMNSAEIFLANFQKVAFINANDPAAFKHWLNTLLPILSYHAKEYQPLYQRLMHLSDSPYFATDWSISFAVQSIVSQYPKLETQTFNELTTQEQDDIVYTTRFIDNVFQEFFSTQVGAPSTNMSY